MSFFPFAFISFFLVFFLFSVLVYAVFLSFFRSPVYPSVFFLFSVLVWLGLVGGFFTRHRSTDLVLMHLGRANWAVSRFAMHLVVPLNQS